MTIDQPASEFFTAGGTLPPNAPSYVKRPTDDELFRHITAGEFCYVLTPRQMGKSSLMIRTAQRLSNEGVKSAIVDLTQIGTVQSEDQWYKGVLTQIKRRLRLNIDPVIWWEQRKDIPSIQKFIEFFEEALSEIREHVVIFIDEVDTTLKLDFRDDFFAGIRAMFNARAENPELSRVAFVLLGVASPSDLIKDRNRTPFNIGQEISLRPFSRDDARMLERGLEEAYPTFGSKILDRVFYWTNGHPYLTQKLCQSIVETRFKEYSDHETDQLVKKLFTSEEASRETNLQFVRDNVLNYHERRVILSLYKNLLRGSQVPDNKNSLPQNHLKLSGLARVEDGKLVVSNKIYTTVFDQRWVRRYTDVDWRYPIIGFMSLVILGFSFVFYNDGVRLPNQAATRVNGIPIYKDDRGIQYLADLFRMKPYVLPNEYEYKAKDVFFNSFGNWDEQKALIEVAYGEPHPSQEDYEVVVTGLYTSLADVDNSGQTTKLLEVMHSSLEKMGMQDDVIYQEIGFWLNARKNVSENKFEDALANYNSAIEKNPQNPATLFERARIYTRQGDFELALKDYEQVIAIVPESNVEPTEGVASTQTLTATFTSHPLDTLTTTPTKQPTTQTSTSRPVTKTVPVETFTPASSITPTKTIPTTVVPTGTSAPPATVTKTPTPTVTLTPTQTATPTATPDSRPIQPRFLTRGQRIAAVKNDINQNENLVLALSQAKPEDYPNLLENSIILTSTPSSTLIPQTSIPTASNTLTPTRMVNLPTLLGTPIALQQSSQFTEIARWGIGGVNVVRWSPDGKTIALGTTSGIFLYDSQTKEERLFIDTQFNVLALSFNIAGDQITVGSPNGIVKSWNSKTGALVQDFIYTRPNSETITNNTAVTAISYSVDGVHLAIGYKNGVINYFSSDKDTANQAFENYPTVEDLVISPDGRFIYASNGTKDIFVWDVQGGEKSTTLSNLTPINRLSLSNNQEWLLTGGDANSVYLWNLFESKHVSSFLNLGGAATAFDFSNDDKYVVIGLSTGDIKIFAIPTSEADYSKVHVPLQSIKGYDEKVLSVATAPDRLIVASGNWEEGLKLWDMQTGENTFSLNASQRTIDEIYFSNDGNWLATSHEDGLVRVWDVNEAQEIYRFEGYLPKGVPFSPDNRFLAFVHSPGNNRSDTIQIVELSTGNIVAELSGYFQKSFVQFTDDSKLLVRGDVYSAKVWDVSTWEEISINGGPTAGCGLYFMPQNELLAVISQAGINFTYDTATQKMCGTKPKGTILKYFFHDKNQLVFVLGDGSLWVGNSDSSGLSSIGSDATFPTSDEIFLAGHQESGWYAFVSNGRINIRNINDSSGMIIDEQDDYQYRVAFSPNGKLLALGSKYGSIHLWTMPSLQVSTEISIPIMLKPAMEGELSDIPKQAISLSNLQSIKEYARLGYGKPEEADVAPDNNHVAIATSAGVIIFEGNQVLKWIDPQRWVTSVQFSPDGATLAIGLRTGEIQLWDWRNETKSTLTGEWHHTGKINRILFSQGSYLYSASADGHIIVWNWETGKSVLDIAAHSLPVNDIAITSDGRTLVTCSDDQLIRVWDLASNNKLYELNAKAGDFSGVIKAVAISADNAYLAAGGEAGYLYQWKFVTSSLPPGNRLQRRADIVPVAKRIWSLEYIRDDKELLVGVDDGKSIVYDASLPSFNGVSLSFEIPAYPLDLIDIFGADFDFSSFTIFDGSNIISINWNGGLIYGESQIIAPMYDNLDRLDFSPDGSILAAGGKHGSTHVWDLTTNRSLYQNFYYMPFGDPIAPDGSTIAIIVPSNDPRVGDIYQLKKLTGAQTTVDLSNVLPNGHVGYTKDGSVFIASDLTTAKAWDYATGNEVDVQAQDYFGCRITVPKNNVKDRLLVNSAIGTFLPGDDAHIDSLCPKTFQVKNNVSAFSRDLNLLAFVNSDGLLEGYDVLTKTARWQPYRLANPAAVTSMAISPDGSVIAVGDSSGKLLFINGKTGQPVSEIVGNFGGLQAIEFSEDNMKIATTGSDGVVHLFGILGAEVSQTTTAALKIDWIEDNNWLISADANAVSFIDTKSAKVVQQVGLGGDSPLSMTIANKRIYILLNDSIKVIDIEKFEVVKTISPIADGVISITASPDGKYLALGISDNETQLLNAEDGSVVRNLRSNFGGWAVAFSPDSQYIVSGTSQGILKWNTATGIWTPTNGGQDKTVKSIAFSHDGKTIAGGGDGFIYFWDSESGELIRQVNDSKLGTVNSLDFSPDDSMLVSGTDDSIVRIWDVNSASLLKELVGHASRVLAVCFSPDGQYIASGANEGSIRIWGLP